jgi:hypothetical protein
MCRLKPMTSDEVICCAVRRYANNYQTLKNVAVQMLGAGLDMVTATDVTGYRSVPGGQIRALDSAAD